jgi:hypothetical protein
VFLHVEDILQLRQEPLVDVGHLPDLIDRVAPMEGGRDSKHTLVSRVYQLFIDILDEVILVRNTVRRTYVVTSTHHSPSQSQKTGRQWPGWPFV